MQPTRGSRRYLGLELSGAKNPKTCLAAIEYYPREGKIFLLDVYEGIGPTDDHTSDESVIETIEELRDHTAGIGVNGALDLPPCLPCPRKTCAGPRKCTHPPVKWMREMVKRASKTKSSEDGPRVKDFTPYTQRPVELWVRYQIFPRLAKGYRFEIDETLGGTRAPLNARMIYLKRHLSSLPILETNPKLTLAILAHSMKIPARLFEQYRSLENGIEAREELLTILADRLSLFVYDRDAKKLAQNLSAFDALISAYTALLKDLDQCEDIPKGFPKDSSSWIYYPQF